jgi:hypothetical protein
VEREVVDAIDTLDGRKTKFIGWTTLAFLGSSKLPTTSSRLAACGVELALKWISTDKKLLADAHMQQLSVLI